MPFRLGPKAREQLLRLSTVWNQGEHVLITGGTNSGKTTLARQLDEIRIQRGSSVVVFVAKMKPDNTIREYYPESDGWVRWTTWKRKPKITETKILLWPRVEGLAHSDAIRVLKKEFAFALEEISRTGLWTVHIDEGLFMSAPEFLGFHKELGMMYALMRSSKGTMITLAQRPSHLPLSIYANIAHAFVGRASEIGDLRRLGNMDSIENSRALQKMISANGIHDFIWIPIAPGWPPERINLAR